MKIRTNSGFTLVELLVAIALGLVILAGLFQTFRTQHDTYIVQDQVAAMQQNLRAAMYLITRDLQMAGWYSNFDRSNHSIVLNDADLGTANGRPLLFSENNSPGTNGSINLGTDALVILKAAAGTGGTISGGATAVGSSIDNAILALSGLDAANNKYGLLVKSDLRNADFFDVNSPSLSDNYLSGDLVFRADIIIYKVNNDAAGRPTLFRRNLGNDNGYQPVAENIDNMQVSYQLNDGAWVNTLTPANQARVRAVEVTLVGRTAHPQRMYTDTNTYNFSNDPAANYTPNDAFRRKALSTTIKTRNVGL